MALARGFSPGTEDTASVGAGVLIAVGLVVVFFTWWSWGVAAGAGLVAAGALWLKVARDPGQA
jgi:hypothetical protein